MFLSNAIDQLPGTHSYYAYLLLAGALVLAWEPALWLVGTWFSDGYEGMGWFAFLLSLSVFIYSGISPLAALQSRSVRPFGLLLAAAILRLLSQVLDIDVIGAVLLSVDFYALAKLAVLDNRQRSVSPLWLAVLFSFSLPIEPIVQRLLGYDLQLVSATIACSLLGPLVTNLVCDGVRLQVANMDVLVDLPCSGAELISVVGLMCALLNTHIRPGVLQGILSLFFCLFVALLGNGARITLLALGLINQEGLPFSVMDPLPHTLIGLVMVALSTVALLGLHYFCRPDSRALLIHRSFKRQVKVETLSRKKMLRACGFPPLALCISALQPHPVDLSPALSPPPAPRVAAGFLRQDERASELERRFFSQYGGGSSRATYGPFGLLLVSTASPLRHLHDPIICFSGAGFSVRLLGTDHPSGTTLYEAERVGEGLMVDRYLVRVSYVSDSGQQASSVSEVIWHWLRAPRSRWTMVQRIFPLHAGMDEHLAGEFESAIRRGFNLVNPEL